MKKIISPSLAGNILLIAFILLVIFHILVLIGVVPPDMIWGGLVSDTATSLVTLELVALLVTAIFVVIVAMKTGYIKAGKFRGAVNIGMWIIFAYLVLNTIGNLASGVSAESLVFAPITLVLAIFAL